MKHEILGSLVFPAFLVAALAGLAAPQDGARRIPPLVSGLDHIPLAVADLDRAAERYRRLGFTLKPGRPHENGIRNHHAKFEDGTEIELISAAEARDALTTEYLRHLASGDGPAFAAFFAPDMGELARSFDAARRAYRRAGGLLSFPEGDSLRYIFFGPRNRSPTDRPEHFRHPNGAQSLVGLWIAGDDLSAERALFAALGASYADEDLAVLDGVRGTVATFREAEVVLLPGSRQLVSGRKIIGAVIRTRSLDAVRQALERESWTVPPVVRTRRGASLLLPPAMTFGLWLEFRER